MSQLAKNGLLFVFGTAWVWLSLYGFVKIVPTAPDHATVFMVTILSLLMGFTGILLLTRACRS